MQVTLEKTGDLDAIIKVQVEENDYNTKVDKELKEIGRTHTIPGFRKGHVSIDQLRRRFGKEVKSRILNDEVFNVVISYLRDNKIDILGEPLPVKVQEVNLDDKDYTFEYEIGLAPKVEADVNKDITIPYYTIAVSEDMVKEQDQALLRRFGSQVPGEEVDATALVKGAIMELDADGNVKTTDDAIQVVAGIVAPMYFHDKAEADKFLGKKVGDKVVFNPAKAAGDSVAELSSMLNIDKERAADVKADFEMAISEIIVLKLAEHNEDFYKQVFAGNTVTTEEEYFDQLRKMIAQQLAPNSEMKFNHDAQEVLMEKFGNIALPAAFLKKWLIVRNEELNEENIDAEFEKMIPGIRWELLSNQIRANQDVKVTEDDMLNFAKGLVYNQFMQYGMTNLTEDVLTDYAKKVLSDQQQARRIHDDVSERKLFNVVKALVTVDSKEVSLDEFKAMVNPAPAAE